MKLILRLMLGAAACALTAPLPAAVPANTNAHFIVSPADLKARIPTQLHMTNPDYVVFVPEVTDTGVNDTGNEHFLVFDGPDGSLMAVWTQSSAEMQPDQHIAFACSTDEGVTWSKPRIIAGPKKPGDGCIASWGYPLVSKKGRIYVLYSQHIGKFDSFFHHTGWLHGIYSDDNGVTWSKPQNVPVARSLNDNPDSAMPPNMLCWQKPLRLGRNGRYFAGFTRWTSFAVRKPATQSWMSADARVEFMRFENVDDNPEPRDLKIHWSAANEKALTVPFPGHPEVSACQEPTVVKLPDGRLFCIMRTASGSPFWSVSSDVGETWTQPRRLLRKDGGEPLLHPLSPCPMYDMGGNEAGSGCYALFIHNHDGHYKNYGPADSSYHRRPIYLVAGRFQPGADQPVWFDEPKFFMDHDGVSLGKPGTNGRLDLALYSSFTVRHGQPVLWYPERKFFLLGRKISNDWFATGGRSISQPSLPVYQPKVKLADIYFYHPGAKPALKYNHDVDIVKFKGRFFAGWNANEARGEDKPGQFNFLSVSDDFEHWSAPIRMFTAEARAKNPVETDNQWQPNFINWKDETLFCAWSDFVARRVFVATSKDGLRWDNREVPNAPAALQGKACGFPTNHGLLTSKGVLLFPCSLPFTDSPRAMVGHTRYAGVLRSEDGGKTWSWSEPIEAVSWAQAGEKPAEFGGDTITLWEPMLFEQADGRIGLLIRNSTAQENPERAEKPHRMLLHAVSADAGRTWTQARPVEVDTICSRNFTVAGVGTPDSLLMVMNDNNVRVPERISHDRYFLALYCAPVCDPDLLLPGPVIQPQGGTAFYPNGFVDDGKLHVAYTYPGGIHSSVVEPLPDFSRPFLLPREGRPGLKIEDGIARFGQRQSSLGLVLTEKLTRQPKLRLAFDVNVNRYNGGEWPVLTLGGKTRGGTSIRAIYNPETKSDVFQVVMGGNKWADIAPFKMKAWNHFEIELTTEGLSVTVNNSPVQLLKKTVLRKICFGGLYVAPPWPMGMTGSSDVRLKLDSIRVE